MARKLRYQPENVCYHVVTRIAHREFFFDDVEKDIVVKLISNVAIFTGVQVLAYCVMSNHLHLMLFIEKPSNLLAWEQAGYFLDYNFDRCKEGDVYRVSEYTAFSQSDVDEFRRLKEMSSLERYEMTSEELIIRLKTVMRPKAFENLMLEWQKLRPEELEAEYERQLSRMYDLSAFMKILKQDISQYYNVRHKHTGGLWEGRFKDSIIERSVEAMSSVATYIDLNPWRAHLVEDPADYKWSSWGAAMNSHCSHGGLTPAGRSPEGSDPTGCPAGSGYNFIYDTGSSWDTVREVHQQQLTNRMSKDTAEAAEREEAVFTSGAIIGKESFVRRVVEMEEEAFPNGHKSAPTTFTVGDTKLTTLRNLGILRGGANAKKPC